MAGEPFDNGVPFHPPGWPYLLAACYRALGLDPAATPVTPAVAKGLVAVLSGLAAAGAALATRLAAGRTALAVMAPLAAFHFGHVVEGTVANSEALYSLLLAMTLVAALAERRAGWLSERRPGIRASAAVVLGALCGVTAVVRAEFLLGGVLVAAWTAWQGPRPSRRSQAATVLVGMALALTPPTVMHWRSIEAFNARNAATLPAPLPRLAPVTSYGAFAFAMANHAEADGGPNSDHPLLVPATADEEALLAAGQLDLSIAAVYRLYTDGYGIGLAWMASHPGDALTLLARKTRVAAGALALGYGPLDAPAGVDGVRRRVDVIEPDASWLLPVHAALTIAGWLVLRRRAPGAAWLVAIPAVTLLASTWLFYGYVRLVLAYLPVLWVAQATALASLAARFGLQRRLDAYGHAAAALLLVAGLAGTAVAAAHPRQAVVVGLTDERGQVLVDETVRVSGPR